MFCVFRSVDMYASQLYPPSTKTWNSTHANHVRPFQAYKRQLVHPKIYIYIFGWQGNQVQVIDSRSKIEKLSTEREKKEKRMIEAILDKDIPCEFN